MFSDRSSLTSSGSSSNSNNAAAPTLRLLRQHVILTGTSTTPLAKSASVRIPSTELRRSILDDFEYFLSLPPAGTSTAGASPTSQVLSPSSSAAFLSPASPTSGLFMQVSQNTQADYLTLRSLTVIVKRPSLWHANNFSRKGSKQQPPPSSTEDSDGTEISAATIRYLLRWLLVFEGLESLELAGIVATASAWWLLVDVLGRRRPGIAITIGSGNGKMLTGVPVAPRRSDNATTVDCYPISTARHLGKKQLYLLDLVEDVLEHIFTCSTIETLYCLLMVSKKVQALVLPVFLRRTGSKWSYEAETDSVFSGGGGGGENTLLINTTSSPDPEYDPSGFDYGGPPDALAGLVLTSTIQSLRRLDCIIAPHDRLYPLFLQIHRLTQFIGSLEECRSLRLIFSEDGRTVTQGCRQAIHYWAQTLYALFDMCCYKGCVEISVVGGRYLTYEDVPRQLSSKQNVLSRVVKKTSNIIRSTARLGNQQDGRQPSSSSSAIPLGCPPLLRPPGPDNRFLSSTPYPAPLGPTQLTTFILSSPSLAPTTESIEFIPPKPLLIASPRLTRLEIHLPDVRGEPLLQLSDCVPNLLHFCISGDLDTQHLYTLLEKTPNLRYLRITTSRLPRGLKGNEKTPYLPNLTELYGSALTLGDFILALAIPSGKPAGTTSTQTQTQTTRRLSITAPTRRKLRRVGIVEAHTNRIAYLPNLEHIQYLSKAIDAFNAGRSLQLDVVLEISLVAQAIWMASELVLPSEPESHSEWLRSTKYITEMIINNLGIIWDPGNDPKELLMSVLLMFPAASHLITSEMVHCQKMETIKGRTFPPPPTLKTQHSDFQNVQYELQQRLEMVWDHHVLYKGSHATPAW